MERPAFNASEYETPELAEINRPLYAPTWDLIEAESALNAMTKARAPKAEWDAQFDIVLAARKVVADLEVIYDAQLAEYSAAAELTEDHGDAADQMDLI